MNFMEMLLALLAIVLFTTLALVYNRNMWNQAENLDNVAQIIQATQLAHSKLDQIDALLFAKKIRFAQNQTNNQGDIIPPYTIRRQFIGLDTAPAVSVKAAETLAYSGYTFVPTYSFTYCNEFGEIDSLHIDQTPANNQNALYIKMMVTIASTPGMSHPVAVSRIYTRNTFFLP